MNRRILSLAIGASLASVALPGLTAELLTVDRPIEGRYIVVLKEQAATLSATSRNGVASVPAVAQGIASQYRAKLRRSYQHALRGFVIDAEDAALAQLLKDPRVAYVEEDGMGSIYATQNNATWGIDRVDQRNLPLSTTYTYDTDAAGVHAYILDTGLRADHTQFTGRVGNGFSVRPGDSSTADCHGHGTHVAGSVAGTTWGVAKKAIVHPVRTFDCSGNGQISEAIAAVDWVTANHTKPAVANMSFGFPASTALDDAVNNMINAGVVAVAAAGNSNDDACSGSPRRVPRALTVGSSDRNDARSVWSSSQASGWGSCVDLFAPGSDIMSAGISSASASVSNSGTSMASPHVAGVAALYLATHPSATSDEVHAAILNNATAGKVTGNLRGSPNFLLNSLFSGGPGPGNQAPVANFSSSVSGLTVNFTDSSTDSDGTIASRSWNFGDGTTSTAANPSKTYSAAGTYNVSLTVTDDDGANHTKTGTVTVGSSGGAQTYTNGTDVTIRDNATVESSIAVSGRTGNAPSNASVSVNIVHTYKGDLKVDLVAPDGTLYNIHNRTGGSADNVSGTVTFNLSSESLNGAWKLRVNDNALFDTGRIDTWSITF